MIFQRESTHQQEIDAVHATWQTEGRPVNLLWVTCPDCGARYFARLDATTLSGLTQEDVERWWIQVEREAAETLELDCPDHDDELAV